MAEFFQTGMGHRFYESTMPEIAKALSRIATAMDSKEAIDGVIRRRYTKEEILKHATEDELFALFHTFKEYYNKQLLLDGTPLPAVLFCPLDKDIGEVVKELKQTYK